MEILDNFEKITEKINELEDEIIKIKQHLNLNEEENGGENGNQD